MRCLRTCCVEMAEDVKRTAGQAVVFIHDPAALHTDTAWTSSSVGCLVWRLNPKDMQQQQQQHSGLQLRGSRTWGGPDVRCLRLLQRCMCGMLQRA